MITPHDIARYLADPETTKEITTKEIASLIELYPYCEPLHWIYLRSLFMSNDLTFDDALYRHGIYVSDHKSLYYYITYTKPEVTTTEHSISDEQLLLSTSVDYTTVTQNEASVQTLQGLAEKLKAARLARQMEIEKAERAERAENLTQTAEKYETQNKQESEKPTINTTAEYYSEETARKMISDRKYLEAREILRQINLNNPKKSAYFALQIKYIETIINNQHKTE